MPFAPLCPEGQDPTQDRLPSSFYFNYVMDALKKQRELILGITVFNLAQLLTRSPLEQHLKDSEYAEPLGCLVAWALMTGGVAIYNAAEQKYLQSYFDNKSLHEAIDPFVYVFAPYLACAMGITSIVFAQKQLETLGPWKPLVQTLVGATTGTVAGLWGGLPQMIKYDAAKLQSTRCNLLKILGAFNFLSLTLGSLHAAGVDSKKLDIPAAYSLMISSLLAVIVACISTTPIEINKSSNNDHYKALQEDEEAAAATNLQQSR
jgi:hypothetical protein